MPKVTAEMVGMAIINAIQTNGVEFFPDDYPGVLGVEGKRELVKLLPPDHRLGSRVRSGMLWIDNHPEHGILAVEHHGGYPAWYFLITDPAQIAAYEKSARFNVRYITSRINRQHRRVENVMELAGDGPAMRAVMQARADEQAAHRMGVRTLAGVMGVAEQEVEEVWLGITPDNNHQPVPTA
jgi:hypothetical protein